jgi:hypothetical protein
MLRKFDLAAFYYWRVEFFDPVNDDDDRYVMLHGDEGEIVGPMTMRLAEMWIAYYDGSPARRFDLLLEDKAADEWRPFIRGW